MSACITPSALPASTRTVAWRLLAFAGLAASLGCAGAYAQPQEVEKVAADVVIAQPVIADEHFDQWVFQNDQNASAARVRLEAVLTLHVEDVDRACQLTAAQKQKLRLAGRGDVKRFFDQFDKVRERFQLIKHDQQKMQEIWQAISPLQMALQTGLFQDGSLLHKSLGNTLTEEQAARYAVVDKERRAFRHRAQVELAIAMVEQAFPLRDQQRRELLALATKHSKPPRKSGQYDFYLVMFQLGQIPEEKVKPLFDDVQWKAFSQQLAQYKGIVPALKQSGYLSDDDLVDGADAPPVGR